MRVRDKKLRNLMRCGRAFSLVELMISAAMIAIIMVALGLAMSRSHQRVAQSRTYLSTIQRRNDLTARIQNELKWASAVHYVGPEQLWFDYTNIEGQSQTIGYVLDPDAQTVERSIDFGTGEVIAEGVGLFDFGWDYDGESVAVVTIRIGMAEDDQGPLERAVYLDSWGGF